MGFFDTGLLKNILHPAKFANEIAENLPAIDDDEVFNLLNAIGESEQSRRREKYLHKERMKIMELEVEREKNKNNARGKIVKNEKPVIIDAEIIKS